MSNFSLKLFFRKVIARKPFDFVLYILSKGSKSNSFISKFIPPNRLFPDNSWRNVTRNGLKFNLDLSHIVDWYIFFGIVEINRVKLYSLMNPGMVIYDIGSNIGDVTLNASIIVGELGTVYSFEPHPKTFLRLQNHIKINNLLNVSAFNVGLGKSKGNFEMLEIKNNAGANRILFDSEFQKGDLSINVVSLDEIIHIKNLSPPDIIKIDVEGFDMNVLIGAKEIIGLRKPILFIEVDDKLLKYQGQSAINLIKFVFDLGYSIENASNNIKVLLTDNFNDCHFDIVAYPI